MVLDSGDSFDNRNSYPEGIFCWFYHQYGGKQIKEGRWKYGIDIYKIIEKFNKIIQAGKESRLLLNSCNNEDDWEEKKAKKRKYNGDPKLGNGHARKGEMIQHW